MGAVEQLALLGVSAAQIAKKTAVARPRVDAALTVAGSENTRHRLAAEELSLDDAAVLAEFEDDEAATERLTRAMERKEPLAHTAQRLRDERTERDEVRAEAERLRAEGVPALDPEEIPELHYMLDLTWFVDSEGHAIPKDQWPTVPGAAVVVTKRWRRVDGEDVPVLETDWIVTDPTAAGLVKSWEYGSGASDTQQSAEQSEANRVERRRVIAGNKAWRSAESVRRQWLASFIARKTAPTGSEALICEAVLRHTFALGQAMGHNHPGLIGLIGDETDGQYGDLDTCERLATEPKTPKAYNMRTLAAVIAAWEQQTGVHTWRNATEWDTRVMGALIAWGYDASDVERSLLDDEPYTDHGDAA